MQVNDCINESLMDFSIDKNGPYEFVIDLIDESIIVIAVVEGGIIQKHGGIKAGDELISVNDFNFTGKPLESVVDYLESLMENETMEFLEFRVKRVDNLTSNSEGFEKIIEADEDDEVTSL